MLATANTRKNPGENMEKLQVNETERYKLARKKCLVVGVACMEMYRSAPGIGGRTFKIWFLDRWVSNFCIRSTPLRGIDEARFKSKYLRLCGSAHCCFLLLLLFLLFFHLKRGLNYSMCKQVISLSCLADQNLPYCCKKNKKLCPFFVCII